MMGGVGWRCCLDGGWRNGGLVLGERASFDRGGFSKKDELDFSALLQGPISL